MDTLLQGAQKKQFFVSSKLCTLLLYVLVFATLIAYILKCGNQKQTLVQFVPEDNMCQKPPEETTFVEVERGLKYFNSPILTTSQLNYKDRGKPSSTELLKYAAFVQGKTLKPHGEAVSLGSPTNVEQLQTAFTLIKAHPGYATQAMEVLQSSILKEIATIRIVPSQKGAWISLPKSKMLAECRNGRTFMLMDSLKYAVYLANAAGACNEKDVMELEKWLAWVLKKEVCNVEAEDNKEYETMLETLLTMQTEPKVLANFLNIDIEHSVAGYHIVLVLSLVLTFIIMCEYGKASLIEVQLRLRLENVQHAKENALRDAKEALDRLSSQLDEKEATFEKAVTELRTKNKELLENRAATETVVVKELREMDALLGKSLEDKRTLEEDNKMWTKIATSKMKENKSPTVTSTFMSHLKKKLKHSEADETALKEKLAILRNVFRAIETPPIPEDDTAEEAAEKEGKSLEQFFQTAEDAMKRAIDLAVSRTEHIQKIEANSRRVLEHYERTEFEKKVTQAKQETAKAQEKTELVTQQSRQVEQALGPFLEEMSHLFFSCGPMVEELPQFLDELRESLLNKLQADIDNDTKYKDASLLEYLSDFEKMFQINNTIVERFIELCKEARLEWNDPYAKYTPLKHPSNAEAYTPFTLKKQPH